MSATFNSLHLYCRIIPFYINMTLKYLITGATGGLGSRVLAYLVANIPRSEYAATSSQEANRASFEKHGIAFLVANYDNPAMLDTAFEDVENLDFVSTENFDTAGRIRQHHNVVEATTVIFHFSIDYRK